MDEIGYIEQQRKDVEKGAIEAQVAWEAALPKIREHKDDLKSWHDKIVDGGEHLEQQWKEIQKKAFDETLEMKPDEVAKLMRDYYEFTRIPGDERFSWMMEYQRHAINEILGEIRNYS